MSIATARRLRKLSYRHRRAAELVVMGVPLKAVGREVGFHPSHVGRLMNYSQLFQEYLEAAAMVRERDYWSSAGRLNDAIVERGLEAVMARRQRRHQPGPTDPRQAASPVPPLLERVTNGTKKRQVVELEAKIAAVTAKIAAEKARLLTAEDAAEETADEA